MVLIIERLEQRPRLPQHREPERVLRHHLVDALWTEARVMREHVEVLLVGEEVVVHQVLAKLSRVTQVKACENSQIVHPL